MIKTYRLRNLFIACLAIPLFSIPSIGQNAPYENYKGINNVEQAKQEFYKDKAAALEANILQYEGAPNGGGIISLELAIPVTNDFCANATPIACGSTTFGSTVGETWDSVGGCGTGFAGDGNPNTAPGVWYSFVATSNSTRLSTCNQASFDTKISVFTGLCGALVCVDGQDDGLGCAGFTTDLVMNTVVGTTYYVLVHGFGSAVGTFNLTLECLCAPITNTITVAMPSTLYQSAGANQPNTYYWGLSQVQHLTANPSGGSGNYTYAWTSKSGYTIVSASSKTAGLYYPTGPGWVKVAITDVNTSCTITDSTYIDFMDYTCPPQPGMIWWYQLCNTQTQTPVCVQRTVNMQALLQTGNYAFGVCFNPKTTIAANNSVGLTVYPNPSSGNMAYTVPSADAASFETHVLDLNGRVLFSETFVGESDMTTRELNLNGFAAGMYLINVMGNNQTFTERIIIQ